MKWDDEIEISYTGSDIEAEDGITLSTFILEEVENTLPAVHPIPGRIEAEDYVFQVGVQLESTSDIGGGQNIGYLDPGDYLDYEVDVLSSGNYRVDFQKIRNRLDFVPEYSVERR